MNFSSTYFRADTLTKFAAASPVGLSNHLYVPGFWGGGTQGHQRVDECLEEHRK